MSGGGGEGGRGESETGIPQPMAWSCETQGTESVNSNS